MSSDAAKAMYPALAAKEKSELRKPEAGVSKPTWAQSNDPVWAAPRERPPDFWWVPYHRKVKR
jgi:hypothetical protein